MEKLKVVYFGYGGGSHLAEDLRHLIESFSMNLITIHEHANANVPWKLDTWLSELKKADIIILPVDYQKFPAKSQNKLTQAMSLGIPVICSPLPAYVEIEKRYPNCCLFATNEDEWGEQLLRLRNSSDFRKEIGQKALDASKEFHIDRMGQKWLDIIKNIKQVQFPLTDIVIPTYKNLRGLKLCLDSIRACTQEPYKIYVVNNGTDQALHDYLIQQSNINYIKKDRMVFAQAVNTGIKAGNGRYVMILNDDVIVSKGWLKELLGACKEGVGVVGPLSNCDIGWLHNISLTIAGVDLLPGQNTFEQIVPIVQDIYDFRSPYFDTPERDWLAFYCTLIPRAVIDKVGLLNESFTNSGEDVDLCRRIKKMGYKIVQNYQSFVFHFGAVSRKLLEKEDFGSYHEADKKTQILLKEIWDKESVMLYSGPSWEKWDFRKLETTGIGGSEVWQVWLSRELSNLGYRVTSFSDCEAPIEDGPVKWLPYTDYPGWVEQNWVDYAILSRTTDPLRFPLRAGKVFVQIHDVWMLSQKDQLFLDRVNKFCALSQWHMDFASNYHGIPKEKMTLTANGLDFKRFDDIKVERNPYRFHWSSSLDRGLDNVLYLWPFIKKEIPEAELHVYYGTLNWREMCKRNNDKEGLKKIDALEVSMGQPGVFNHGRKNQKEIAEEIKKASIWLYPSAFSETFCCLPENKIFTDSGFKSIIDICLKDKVLTHRNRFRSINKLMSRNFSGKVYGLKMQNQMHDTGYFTEEHPILILTGMDVKKIKGFKNHNYKIQPIYSNWVSIKDVKVGDYVCFPAPEVNNIEILFRDFLKDMKLINRNYKEVNNRVCYRDNDKYKGFPRFIEMDCDFARFLGLYLAEGSNSLGTITFAFNTKEIDYVKFIERIFDKLDINHRREVHGNSTNIKACCHSLSVWLKYFFGSNAAEKTVPNFLYQMPKEFIFSFIKGVLDGDGCYGPYDIKVQLASESAILNLKMLMQMINLYPSYLRPEKKSTLGGEERCYFSVSIAKGQWYRYLGDQNKKIQNSFFKFNGNAFFKVREIEKKEYSGLVYNMEVEEDNSYVSGFQAVHNCITGIEAQYAGVPVICNKYAGVITTLQDSAIMLGNGDPYWPYSEEGRKQFLSETLSLLKDRNKWQEWSDKGRKNAEEYSWKNCALIWRGLFEK